MNFTVTLASRFEPKSPLRFASRTEALDAARVYARCYGTAALVENSTGRAQVFHATDANPRTERLK